ncbi:MAG: hypothetical protein R8G66_29525 [Cytophagales bacterium]|nr:hypothetical protein [Cytophagales bacterium]
MKKPDQALLERISRRELKDSKDEISAFVEDLLCAGASPNFCMELLSKKFDLPINHARHMFLQTETWARRGSNNPFTQQFLDMLAEEDDAEVTRENGRVVSVKIDLKKG